MSTRFIDSTTVANFVNMSQSELEREVAAGLLVGTREMTGRVLIEIGSLETFLRDRAKMSEHARQALVDFPRWRDALLRPVMT